MESAAPFGSRAGASTKPSPYERVKDSSKFGTYMQKLSSRTTASPTSPNQKRSSPLNFTSRFQPNNPSSNRLSTDAVTTASSFSSADSFEDGDPTTLSSRTPVNAKSPTADLMAMFPNRKVSGGKRYATARKLQQQQQQQHQQQQPNRIANDGNRPGIPRPLNIAPKTPSSLANSVSSPPLPKIDRPPPVPPPRVSTSRLYVAVPSKYSNQINGPSNGNAPLSPVSPLSAGSSNYGPKQPKAFHANHASIYTTHDDREWTDEDEPMSPQQNHPGLASNFSPRQEISPPITGPTSPKTGRNRAFSNNRINNGDFDSPVASLLGRLDQALSAALARAPEGLDPNYTPVSESGPDGGYIFSLSSSGVETDPPSHSSTVKEFPLDSNDQKHLRNSDPVQSITSSLTDLDSDGELEVIRQAPAPPPRNYSLKKRVSTKKLREKASRHSIRKSIRDRIKDKPRLSNSNSVASSPRLTPSNRNFRLPDEDVALGEFRLDLDFDAIQAFLKSELDIAPEDELRPDMQNSISPRSASEKLRLSFNEHLAAIDSVERAILAVEEDLPRKETADRPRVAPDSFAEKRKMRQSVVRRLDGVLLEAMELTGDYFDEDDFDDWEDMEEEEDDEHLDETTGTTTGDQTFDSIRESYVDDNEIESWRSLPRAKLELRTRPEVGDGMVPGGGRISTPDLDEVELSLPRRFLSPEDLSKLQRNSALRRSQGEKPPGLFLRNSTASSRASSEFPGPLSPLQPVVPKASPTRRKTISPRPEVLSDFLYKTPTEPESGNTFEAPGMVRSASSPASPFATAAFEYTPPPLPQDPSTFQAPASSFGSQPRSYAALNNESTSERKLFNRRAGLPIISIESGSSDGEQPADFHPPPLPKSAPVGPHAGFDDLGYKSFTLGRPLGGTFLRTSMDSAASSNGDQSRRDVLKAAQGKPSFFTKIKLMGKNKDEGNANNISLDSEPSQNSESIKQTDKLAASMSMSRSKSAGSGFGRVGFGKKK
ncbi:hypothetical protein HDU97_003176 [Phlyctochytrium planicorne]|nr:hypothetical protein HDU97_003176 [Phlyctochytrium planicorne]